MYLGKIEDIYLLFKQVWDNCLIGQNAQGKTKYIAMVFVDHLNESRNMHSQSIFPLISLIDGDPFNQPRLTIEFIFASPNIISYISMHWSIHLLGVICQSPLTNVSLHPPLNSFISSQDIIKCLRNQLDTSCVFSSFFFLPSFTIFFHHLILNTWFTTFSHFFFINFCCSIRTHSIQFTFKHWVSCSCFCYLLACFPFLFCYCCYTGMSSSILTDTLSGIFFYFLMTIV